MSKRPAKRPELGALRSNSAPEAIDRAPTLLVRVVRIMVTPVPAMLSQVEHFSTPLDWTVRLPAVTQYVPGARSTVWPAKTVQEPVICVLAVSLMLAVVNDVPATTQLPLSVVRAAVEL